MAQPNERSISEVFNDIARHIQEIVRSELALAKLELKREGKKALQPAVSLCAGAVLGVFVLGFFLLMCMFLLWRVMPWWLGALVIWVILAPITLILVSSGLAGLRRIHPTPERTVRTVKKNVQWAKEQMH